ncbi:flagellar motor protein MotD [Novilysobacter selenitireducens]|uniref:Flagellar motor protein MotD n=1 Tax=Novilysobacter selenitireducens TaxID=2872639 RepID=A0ABS7T9B0_9GAMM|nr:flagellar motor protein MotD [Lysobacter selenitireducens]MBZ4040466.1 flagellar motor protein MotD [Lysobacter selenitireducens]
MAGRRHKHEDHVNHEAWAIPYGDLVTLLLAFFVVMYAISSVNEGKYRVLADALSSAFGGQPRTVAPIQLGATQIRGSAFDRPSMQTPDSKSGPSSATPVSSPAMRQVLDMPTFGAVARKAADGTGNGAKGNDSAKVENTELLGEVEGRNRQLHSLGRRIQQALSELVKQKLVTVRRGDSFLEVEIQSDILFASGSAAPSPVALSTVHKLADILRAEPNAVRVEGYTDNVPINTVAFRSNWELSSARAAGVVHELVDSGVSAQRLAVVGFGEHQPVADNATIEGRNANRRVLLVILASPQSDDAVGDDAPAVVDATPRSAAANADSRVAQARARPPATPADAPKPTPAPAQRGPVPPERLLPILAIHPASRDPEAG